jgi:hypothetical protein
MKLLYDQILELMKGVIALHGATPFRLILHLRHERENTLRVV